MTQAGPAGVRPGHIKPDIVLASVVALERLSIEVVPPLIVVAERRNNELRVRVRQLVA